MGLMNSIKKKDKNSNKLNFSSHHKQTLNQLMGSDKGILYLHVFFFLCFEGLNRLIQKAAGDETNRGFSLCKNGPHITHFFFVDDSLLFFRANLD